MDFDDEWDEGDDIPQRAVEHKSVDDQRQDEEALSGIRSTGMSSAEVCAGVSDGTTATVSVQVDGRSYTVLCDKETLGGPWILVSSRHRDVGSLFGHSLCTSLTEDCSGHVPRDLSCGSELMAVMLRTLDGKIWMTLSLPPEMIEFFVGERHLDERNRCGMNPTGDHVCRHLSSPARVRVHSDNFAPRSRDLELGWMDSGGLALFREGGQTALYHGVSFNFAPVGDADGPLFISGAGGTEQGDVVHGQPGAMFYSCRPDGNATPARSVHFAQQFLERGAPSTARE